VLHIVDGIAAWTSINGEGIYSSRPWKVFGENPANVPVVKSGNFNENKVKYSAQYIRFTTKGDTLYAFCPGKPADDIRIVSLGSSSKLNDYGIASVSLVGSDERLPWKQKKDALVIRKPDRLPPIQVHIVGFRVEVKK
jgi:alpha-L-fucosidase